MKPGPNRKAWRPTGSVPAGLAEAFAAAGWVRRPSESALIVHDCGADWEAGLKALTHLPEAARARAVLVGEDAPKDIGERLRGVGGLAWMAPPWPAWLFPMLAATRERARRERPLHRIHELAKMEELAGTSVDDVLAGLAAHVSGLLRASTEIWLRRDPSAPFGLAIGPSGPARCPPGLPESTVRFAAPVVVPCLAAARICSMPDPPAASAVAVPLLRHGALDEPGAVMVLVWEEPFLPTVGEFRLLEMLGVLGRVMLRRLYERDRLLRGHAEHARTMISLLARPHDPRGAATSPTADDLVERVLATRASHPDLVELHARLSAASRGTPRWHHWFRHGGAPDEATLRQALDWGIPGKPRRTPDGRWEVVEQVGPRGSFGALVGVFTSRHGAISGGTTLSDLAGSLALGARVLRWSADNDALDTLSHEQTEGAVPGDALRGMLGRIVTCMEADGGRVHIVRRTCAGPVLEVQHTWPRASAPLPDLTVARTGGWRSDSTDGGASCHLMVAMSGAGRPAGVLEVWRTSPQPFDETLDPDALLRFAPHVAAASRRVLQAELVHARLEAMSGLLVELEPGCPIRQVGTRVTERIGRLAGAAAALLLRRAPGDHGPIYVEVVWCADDGLGVTLGQAIGDLMLELGEVAWTEVAGPRVDALLDEWGLADLRHRATIASPHAPGQQPTSAVLLIDALAPERDLAPLAPEAQDESATELVRYATALMENATRSTARYAADRVATIEPSSVDDRPRPDTIVIAAARAIHAATEVDAVVVALGDRTGVRVRYAEPDRSSLHALELPRDGALDAESERLLRRAFGWKAIRCAVSVPVEYRNRRLGLIWVLSSERGPYIGWHRQEVLRQVAGRLAVELDKSLARSRLEDLNAISARLSGKTGVNLARDLHAELTPWVRQYVRPDAEVVVVARSYGQQALVTAAPAGWDDGAMRAMHQASRMWGRRVVRLRPGELEDVPVSAPYHGLALPIVLREADQLTGHLILLDATNIEREHQRALEDAARELAVVLDSERVRHGLMAETGLFRHALLSPIQGLTDAALYLADLASMTDPDPEAVVEQRERILSEAEKVRQWRTIQRLYGGGLLGGEIRLRPRRQPLRPVIELCIERFAVTMKRRGITQLLDWELRGQGVFSFDADAMDIMLSNLIDNAAKYTFQNRHVTVGAWVDRARLHIWVQDTGHPLPEDVNIYATGERLRWEDPFRVIHGEGLGLSIVRSLIIAHGGDITHECRPENPNPGPEQREGTRPYVVRFTLSLPRDDLR